MTDRERDPLEPQREREVPDTPRTRAVTAARTPAERERVKAQMHVAEDVRGWTTADDIAVTVTSARVDGNALEVVCSASKDGQPLALDLPFRYVNPPILVRDDAVSTSERDVYRDDPAEAFRQIVTDTVRLFA